MNPTYSSTYAGSPVATGRKHRLRNMMNSMRNRPSTSGGTYPSNYPVQRTGSFTGLPEANLMNQPLPAGATAPIGTPIEAAPTRPLTGGGYGGGYGGGTYGGSQFGQQNLVSSQPGYVSGAGAGAGAGGMGGKNLALPGQPVVVDDAMLHKHPGLHRHKPVETVAPGTFGPGPEFVDKAQTHKHPQLHRHKLIPAESTFGQATMPGQMGMAGAGAGMMQQQEFIQEWQGPHHTEVIGKVTKTIEVPVLRDVLDQVEIDVPTKTSISEIQRMPVTVPVKRSVTELERRQVTVPERRVITEMETRTITVPVTREIEVPVTRIIEVPVTREIVVEDQRWVDVPVNREQVRMERRIIPGNVEGFPSNLLPAGGRIADYGYGQQQFQHQQFGAVAPNRLPTAQQTIPGAAPISGVAPGGFESTNVANLGASGFGGQQYGAGAFRGQQGFPQQQGLQGFPQQEQGLQRGFPQQQGLGFPQQQGLQGFPQQEQGLQRGFPQQQGLGVPQQQGLGFPQQQGLEHGQQQVGSGLGGVQKTGPLSGTPGIPLSQQSSSMVSNY